MRGLHDIEIIMTDNKKISIWQRLRNKYRVSVLNEDTLAERWHIHLSAWGAISVAAMLFLFTMLIFSLLIIYTPIKHYLPGYSEDIRQQLVVETARVDSIGTSLELQRQYLNIIKQVVAGEVHSDTVQSLDSMQIIMREQLLEAKNEATQEFIAQYEEKEKDYLQLFDAASNNDPLISFFPPTQGVLLPNTDAEQGVLIKTKKNENITAVLTGTVVCVNYEIGNTYTLMLQHDNYLSIYRNAVKALKKVGDNVRVGETIALSGENPLFFQLWHNGKAIDPETVIAF